MSGITCYDVNDFLKALADDARRNIRFLLRDRGMSVSELCEHLTVQQPTISHHLGILRRAGLVTARRDGLWIYYRANPACVAECCDEILARFRGRQAAKKRENEVQCRFARSRDAPARVMGATNDIVASD